MILYKITFKQSFPRSTDHDGHSDVAASIWSGKTFYAIKHPDYNNWYKFWEKVDNNKRKGWYNASVTWIENIVELP
jgi:hypothetical protein